MERGAGMFDVQGILSCTPDCNAGEDLEGSYNSTCSIHTRRYQEWCLHALTVTAV